MSLRLELDKDLERKFRELAMRRYGFSKGAIKKAAETAIKRWTETSEAGKKEKNNTIAKSLKLLETGVKLKKWKFNREEIYADRFKRYK